MNKSQKSVEKFLKARGWEKSEPTDFAKSIIIEAAELLELFQWGAPKVGELKKDKEKLDNIKKELADVFIYALDLAVILGLDAEKIIKDKLEYNGKKFPAKVVKGNQDYYYQVKKEYRKKGF